MAERSLCEYLMLWVTSREDVIIVPKDSCLTCIERKLHCRVIKSWTMSREERREFDEACGGTLKRYGSVQCECKDYPDPEPDPEPVIFDEKRLLRAVTKADQLLVHPNCGTETWNCAVDKIITELGEILRMFET